MALHWLLVGIAVVTAGCVLFVVVGIFVLGITKLAEEVVQLRREREELP